MGNLSKIRHRMFAKPPMSENTCRGDRPVAPTLWFTSITFYQGEAHRSVPTMVMMMCVCLEIVFFVGANNFRPYKMQIRFRFPNGIHHGLTSDVCKTSDVWENQQRLVILCSPANSPANTFLCLKIFA